ncbi:MAG TPA: hypothetical protein VFX76_05770 [Roseiflexaceae bacterium]|nr:hypothetical protein [Roseiflexaceae bacterium]
MPSAVLVAIVAVVLATTSCSLLGVAVRAGSLPAFDWQVPTGPYQRLLIHNGPTFSCSPYALRDSCGHRSARYEFYIHYISPEQNRELLWMLTRAP